MPCRTPKVPPPVVRQNRRVHRTPEWWREAIVYQVYPRSYADANGDGIGDIAGIRSKVPYLRDLGVDAVWLSPHYPSPMLDAGYDVADYRDIDPRFGTVDEVREELLKQWRVFPAEYITLINHYAQTPAEVVVETLDIFQRHIKPALDEVLHASVRAAAE